MAKFIPKLLGETPKGTKMYLAITNRVMTNAWIGEVTYDGYTTKKIRQTYSDYKVAPCSWTEDQYTVNFLYKRKKISIICSDPSHVMGPVERGYETQEHLEYGKGYLDKCADTVRVYGCVDTYFTTDKELFRKYLAKEEVPQKVSTYLDTEIQNLQNMKDMMKETIENLFTE